MLVILHDRVDKLTAERFYGAPSVAIEVISYSSKRTDRLQKRQLYLDEGVDEYWVIDPELSRVERCSRSGGAPKLVTDALTWKPHDDQPPFQLDLRKLFAHVHRGLPRV